MSEETKTPAESTVSDEEPDAASGGVEETEEEVSEVPEPVEEEVKEPTDNRERSQLGRKVKELEERLAQRDERIDTLVSKLDMYLTKPAEPEEIDPNDAQELRNFVRVEVKNMTVEEQRAKEAYETDYGKSFLAHGKEEPDFDGIYDEMFTHFNHIVTGDPKVDARINYAEARASFLAKKNAKPKVNLKGDSAKGVGVGGGTIIKDKIKPATKLSPEAQEMIDDMRRRNPKFDEAKFIERFGKA